MTTEKLSSSDTILVAIDGSLPSQMAAWSAVQIAQKQDLSIEGLYVVGERTVMLDQDAHQAELGVESKPTARSDLVNQFRSKGDNALDWLDDLCTMSEVAVKTDIFFGDIPGVILQKAKQSKILALGRRGHMHNSSPYELGENYHHIVPYVHIPILIGGEEKADFHRILAILDSHDETNNVLNWASILQNSFKSEILVSIYHESEMHVNRSSSMLAQIDQRGLIEYQKVLEPVQSGADIAINAEDHHVDLIIMEGYRRAALGFWLEKHPLEDVLRDTELLVFAV